MCYLKVSESEEKVKKKVKDLDWVHRAGNPMLSSEKPRPIVVRFLQLKDKLEVLEKGLVHFYK